MRKIESTEKERRVILATEKLKSLGLPGKQLHQAASKLAKLSQDLENAHLATSDSAVWMLLRLI